MDTNDHAPTDFLYCFHFHHFYLFVCIAMCVCENVLSLILHRATSSTLCYSMVTMAG